MLRRSGTKLLFAVAAAVGNIIEGFRDVAPHAGLDLRVYAFINDEHRIARAESWDGIAFVVIMVLCAAAMLWLTSQRSRVVPVNLPSAPSRASSSASPSTRWRRLGSARLPLIRGCQDLMSIRLCCLPGSWCSSPR
jgi:hypothetical protein